MLSCGIGTRRPHNYSYIIGQDLPANAATDYVKYIPSNLGRNRDLGKYFVRLDVNMQWQPCIIP